MKAIVYVSETGHTAQYARLLSARMGLPAYDLKQAKRDLPKGTEIFYMGWLCASTVKGYSKAKRRFSIAAVCGVGLCDTGCLLDEVRRAISLPSDVPLFTLQGGIDLEALRGINKMMIATLTKVFVNKKDKTEDDKRMVELLTHTADYVSVDNLTAVMAWWEGQR